MKIFDYKGGGLDPADIRPDELAEITLQAGPAELRKIDAFLNACADGMEARGKGWEHEHLSDRIKQFEGGPYFVVFNPEAALRLLTRRWPLSRKRAVPLGGR